MLLRELDHARLQQAHQVMVAVLKHQVKGACRQETGLDEHNPWQHEYSVHGNISTRQLVSREYFACRQCVSERSADTAMD